MNNSLHRILRSHDMIRTSRVMLTLDMAGNPCLKEDRVISMIKQKTDQGDQDRESQVRVLITGGLVCLIFLSQILMIP